MPLFPLPVVALPGEAVPLHIFEERYKAMIAACRTGDPETPFSPFGIILARGRGVAEVGCSVTVRKVLREYPDGRLDLVAVGGSPFAVTELLEGTDYLRARVELLGDADEVADGALQLRVHALTLKLAEVLGREAPSPSRPFVRSFGVAATMGLDTSDKQRLLELRSENLRLALLADIFRRIIGEVGDAESARRTVDGNGKLRTLH